MKKIIYSSLLFMFFNLGFSQNPADSLSGLEPVTLEKELPLKIQHAEPLYIDLMRDLGARKGEAEFNLGFGVANHKSYYEYNGFIEYEWAVADRLGLEVEIPFSFNNGIGTTYTSPNNRIEGIKLATQYTFLVNERYQTSLAVGYLHEFELSSFKTLSSKGPIFDGMKMNPIFIAAKKMNNFHTLLYMGPIFENKFNTNKLHTYATLNASLHYMVPGNHFIGIENNMEIHKNEFVYVMRPQMKVVLLHNLSIGLLTGIPITHKDDMKMDFMTRIIWEPNFK